MIEVLHEINRKEKSAAAEFVILILNVAYVLCVAHSLFTFTIRVETESVCVFR